jgi:Tfp pilus assembly protein PilZ
MATNKNELNIYEVNSFLFQIVSCMGETERREFRSVLSDNLTETGNHKDLSLLISSISETERRYLLKKLVNWYHSKSIELREYPRKPFSMSVEHSTNDARFIYFIQNISDGGVFIQTDVNFQTGQQIIMNFSLFKVDQDIAVSGKVARVNSHGIGVKFDEHIDAKLIVESSISMRQL